MEVKEGELADHMTGVIRKANSKNAKGPGIHGALSAATGLKKPV
jgi:hypothetical protein